MIMIDRRTMFVGFAGVLVLPRSAIGARTVPTILFVCQAGTAKSAIARELLRKRARERGVAVVAFSRGLAIEDHVSPGLRQKLAAEHIETERDGFAVLTAHDLRRADIVVTFTPIPAEYRARHLLDWSSVPSVNDRYAVARADLDRRIGALLDAIVATGRADR
jgi:hypothetical protein